MLCCWQIQTLGRQWLSLSTEQETGLGEVKSPQIQIQTRACRVSAVGDVMEPLVCFLQSQHPHSRRKVKLGLKCVHTLLLFPYPLGILNEVGSQAPYEVP